MAAGRLPTLFPTLMLPRRWLLGSREGGRGAEQWRLVRSGNDPPVFRVPRKGERPMFCPLWGSTLLPVTSQDRGRPDRDWISLVSHSCFGSGFGTFNRVSSFNGPGNDTTSPGPSFSPS